MSADGIGLRDIEAAAVRGWPALETRLIAGWLARASSGGSVRANSVSALSFDGRDLDAAIAEVVAFYRERKALPRFNITQVSAPPGIDRALAERGWEKHGAHVTMAKDVGGKTFAELAPAAPGIEIVTCKEPTSSWYSVYLEGLTADRKAVAPRLVERVPEPRIFLAAVREGRVIGSGLTVHDGALASVQCMATLPEARRTGAARAILARIEAEARAAGLRRLYLQTDCANVAAVTLYSSAGFEVAGTYHTRDLLR